MTGDIRKYYDLQKRLNFSLLSLFNLFSTFYSMAANEGHKKPNVNLQSRSLKGKVRAKIISPFMHQGFDSKSQFITWKVKINGPFLKHEKLSLEYSLTFNLWLWPPRTPLCTPLPPPPIHLTFLIGAEDWDKVFMSDQQDTQSSQSLKIGSNQHLQDLWRKPAIIVFGMS